MLGRGKPVASMQKTYDDCYLTCSTAVYFESQNNESEALRSWRNALDQIYYHNAYRMPTGWRPRSETEKALQESLRQMELQCKERVDLLEALRQSRDEAQENEGKPKATTSSTSIPLQEGADHSSNNNSGWLGGGSIPPVGYSDISRPTPPVLPSRNKRPSYNTKSSSGNDVPRSRASPSQPAVATFPQTSMLAPQVPTIQRKSSRTPSPEKRGGMLRTLRAGGKERTGSSGKLSTATFRTKPPAAAKAATQAWGNPSRGGSVGSLEQATAEVNNSMAAPVWDPYTRTLVDSSSSRPPMPPQPASAPPVPPHSSAARPLQTQVRPPSPSDYFVQPTDANPDTYLSDSQRPPYPDHSSLNPVQPSRAYASSYEDLGPPSPITSPRPRQTTANTPRVRKQSPVRKLEPVSLPSYRNEYLPAQPSKYKKPPNARPPKTVKDLAADISLSAAIDSAPIPPKPKVAPPIPRKAVGVVNAAKARQQLDDRTVSSCYSADEHSSGKEGSTKVRRKKKPAVEESSPAQTKIVETVPLPEIVDVDEAANSPSESSSWDERVKHLLNNLPRGVDEAAAKQILNEIVIQGDEVHWDDVAGLEIAKAALKETVVYPFLRPDLFMGLREPARGMLLFGPPGTGKTMLARAVATESRSTFFAISASSLTSKYLGESEKLVRALFSLAKALAPSIIFVDEIDSLLSARGGGSEHEATRRIKTEFLIQWSDLAKAAAGRETSDKDKERGDASRVLVLAATNLPWAIDEAARRRFVRRQYIPLPEDWVRKSQLKTLMSAQKHGINDQDLDQLVYLTEGFSGSDITALAKDAAMGPLRSLGEKLLHMSPDDIRPIDVSDFQASLVNIRPSVSASGLKEFEDWAKEFGERGG